MYFLCFFLDTHLSKLTFCLRITARSDHPLLCSILEVLWIESYGINRGDGLQREEWRGNEHKVENLSIHIHTHTCFHSGLGMTYHKVWIHSYWEQTNRTISSAEITP